MDDKSLRKLNRKALLEILLEQAKRIEEMERELDELGEKLESKRILISNVGSLAEASLKLSDIFKAADEAVKIHMKNVEEVKKEMLEEVERNCKKTELEAEESLKEITNKINELRKEC